MSFGGCSSSGYAVSDLDQRALAQQRTGGDIVEVTLEVGVFSWFNPVKRCSQAWDRAVTTRIERDPLGDGRDQGHYPVQDVGPVQARGGGPVHERRPAVL